MRHLLIVLLLVCTLPVAAQEDASLTKEFAKLSAKERNRIAQQEREEAAADAPYQALMSEAEELFRQQRYEEAMDRFIQARTRRPYNVHPKVKIEDLQALIDKRDAAIRAIEPPATLHADTAPAALVPVLQPTTPIPPVTQHVRPQVIPTVPPEPAKPTTPEPVPAPEPARTEAPAMRIAPPPTEQFAPRTDPKPASSSPAEILPEGVHERIYREGRALVLERQVVGGGQTVVYRRVTHPWGEVVHFRDGIAIPERAWTEAFGAE